MFVFLNPDRRGPSGEILPPDPAAARWLRRVRDGERFRLNFLDGMTGPLGEPYLRLPLARPDEEGCPFSELALYLYNINSGALLCDSEGTLGPRADFRKVSYGDVADFLLTGAMLDRVPCAPPWGYPKRFIEDYVGVLEDPDSVVLPFNVQNNIRVFFREHGVRDATVSLLVRGGLRCLWFQYQTAERLTNKRYENIAGRVFWYLPSYYAVLVSPGENLKGAPL